MSSVILNPIFLVKISKNTKRVISIFTSALHVNCRCCFLVKLIFFNVTKENIAKISLVIRSFVNQKKKKQTIGKKALRFFKEFKDFWDGLFMLYFDITYDWFHFEFLFDDEYNYLLCANQVAFITTVCERSFCSDQSMFRSSKSKIPKYLVGFHFRPNMCYREKDKT